MKASVFIAILLLLPLLLPRSHGIRLGKTFMKVEAPYSNGDAEADIDGHGLGGVHYSCESTQCKGNNRKLLTATTAAPAASKGHAKKAEFSVSSPTTEFEHYHDIIDIAGMDYSPAKRKPPIHN